MRHLGAWAFSYKNSPLGNLSTLQQSWNGKRLCSEFWLCVNPHDRKKRKMPQTASFGFVSYPRTIQSEGHKTRCPSGEAFPFLCDTKQDVRAAEVLPFNPKVTLRVCRTVSGSVPVRSSRAVYPRNGPVRTGGRRLRRKDRACRPTPFPAPFPPASNAACARGR